MFKSYIASTDSTEADKLIGTILIIRAHSTVVNFTGIWQRGLLGADIVISALRVAAAFASKLLFGDAVVQVLVVVASCGLRDKNKSNNQFKSYQ